jgi:hypothetical protein
MNGARLGAKMDASVTVPFVASAQAPFLILALADGDGAVANVLALQNTSDLRHTWKSREQQHLHFSQRFAEALGIAERYEAVSTGLAQPLVEDDLGALEGGVALEGADEGVVVHFVAEISHEAPAKAMSAAGEMWVYTVETAPSGCGSCVGHMCVRSNL